MTLHHDEGCDPQGDEDWSWVSRYSVPVEESLSKTRRRAIGVGLAGFAVGSMFMAWWVK